MPIHTLTDFEKFSITRPYLNELSRLNNSAYAFSGPLASRIIGIATLSLASLADALLHSVACFGVGMTGIIVSPFNFLAFAFFPEYSRSENFELSSSLVHLMMSVESLFNAAILPFLCLLNPDRASRWMSSRTAKDNLLNASGARIAELQQHYDQSQRNCRDFLNEKNQCQRELEEKERINQALNGQLVGRESFFTAEQMRANQLVEEKERTIAELNRQLTEQNQHFINELSREKNQLLVKKYEVGEQFLNFKNQTLEKEAELNLKILGLSQENKLMREKNLEIVHQANQEKEKANAEFTKKLNEQNDCSENKLFRETNRIRIEKSEVTEQLLIYKNKALLREHLIERRLSILINEKNTKIKLLDQEKNLKIEQLNKYAQDTLDLLNEEKANHEKLHHQFAALLEQSNESKIESEQRAELLESYSEKWTKKETTYQETIKDLRKTVTELEVKLKNK